MPSRIEIPLLTKEIEEVGQLENKYNNKNITGKSNLSFIKIRDLNNSTDKYIFEVDKAQEFFKRNNSQERYLKKKRTEELRMPHLKPKSITKRYRKLRNPSRNDQNIDSYHPSSIDREQGCYSKVCPILQIEGDFSSPMTQAMSKVSCKGYNRRIGKSFSRQG